MTYQNQPSFPGQPPMGYPGQPPQGYPPPGYPQPQGGYPQPSYPPVQYPPQPAYTQPAYTQPPPGYPQPGYPSQPGYPPQGQPAYPPQGFQPQMLSVMPSTHGVDDAAASAALAAQAASGGRVGPIPNFLKVPGPQGQVKWDQSVPINYEGKIRVRLLPPWAPGKQPWFEYRNFFFKSYSHPKGMSLAYTGEDSLFMSAIRLALQQPDPNMQKLAEDVGRVRRQFLYNVADVGNPATHYGTDGIMRPFVWSAGIGVQTEIKRLTEVRGGISGLCHAERGRDLLATKKKTGPDERNVEWGVVDMDPAPLAQPLWPLLTSLWDLEALNRSPTQDEVISAIRELRLPMPATGASFGQVPQSYNPNPNPTGPSPYQGQPMPPQPPMGNPQYGNAQYPSAPPAQPQPQQWAGQQGQPQYPGQPGQVTQPAPQPWQGQPPPPPMGPPPVSSYPGQMPQQMGGMPPGPPPPPMAPPPVQSQPGPSGYAPNPGNPGNLPQQHIPGVPF